MRLLTFIWPVAVLMAFVASAGKFKSIFLKIEDAVELFKILKNEIRSCVGTIENDNEQISKIWSQFTRKSPDYFKRYLTISIITLDNMPYWIIGNIK